MVVPGGAKVSRLRQDFRTVWPKTCCVCLNTNEFLPYLNLHLSFHAQGMVCKSDECCDLAASSSSVAILTKIRFITSTSNNTRGSGRMGEVAGWCC